ncbi:MAG: ATP-binding protein [Chloroflexota bacterium]|nr:HAMP domain-containing histidine kinase [Anaerolineae bacterium]HMM27832.1 ATP-binding protein [Aggregatilineaceae bacterium]
MSLRARLLASYVAILLVTLLLVGVVLVVFLRSRPLPTEGLVRDLATTLLDIGVRGVGRVAITTSEGSREAAIITFLGEEALLSDKRLMILTADQRVVYDSSGTYGTDAAVRNLEQEALLTSRSGDRTLITQGRFEDPDGREWLYVSQAPQMHRGDRDLAVVVAAPVPRPTLRQLFQAFGGNFFRPLARASAIALLVALILSALIARSVARPLQHISRVAERLAGGDTSQRAPVSGPPEVRALAESFNDMAARVAATQQAQRDFLANVSHDLRTPLTSIQGFSQAIADGVTSDPQAVQSAAQIIHDETARLNRLVNSLLDLARLEAGRDALARRPVQIDAILRAVTDSLTVRAQEQNTALSLDIPAALPPVSGDGDRLAQVFTNLIDNALRHTPPGASVTIRARTVSDGVTIAVQDSGAGIPPEDLPRIFERFYQVDKSRQRSPNTEGLGLGLAIAREIVEAHGGTISAASTPGHGATFTVWLPAARP